MKALELVVYHPIPCGGPCQCDSYVLPGGDLVSVQSVNVEAKRLTDAELAAEYWRAKWTGLMAEKYGNCLTDEGRAKIATVERFMELPHCDDPTETGNE